MIEIIDKTKCCGCHACYNVCPKTAIEMAVDEKGFKYPRIDETKCIGCNLCEKVCPILNKKEVVNEPVSYACYNKNEVVRKDSSSGGIFTLLAEKILEKNGIIYGASFNNEWLVEHIRIDNKNDLYKLRTSKYLQSSINDTYKQAKKDLDENRLVLFTGTPCQVNGFISYLNGKQYDNLYTQDIICHGVPSPKVWKKYLNYREKLDGQHPMRINFRQKDDGWNLFALLLQYSNNAYKTNHDDDLFMQAFLRNACLRDSCYNCSFKSKNRQTDITLADFWGVENIVPQFNDDKGTSLVIVNTKKGQKLFDDIKDHMIYQESDFEESLRPNPSMYKSVAKPKNQEYFFANLNKLDFDELVEKYTIKPKPATTIRRVLSKIKRIIMHLIKD